MAYVKVYRRNDNEEAKNVALENALRAFRKQVEAEGTMYELRKREQFVSNTVIRRNKLKEAQKRERKLKAKNRRRYN